MVKAQQASIPFGFLRAPAALECDGLHARPLRARTEGRPISDCFVFACTNPLCTKKYKQVNKYLVVVTRMNGVTSFPLTRPSLSLLYSESQAKGMGFEQPAGKRTPLLEHPVELDSWSDILKRLLGCRVRQEALRYACMRVPRICERTHVKGCDLFYLNTYSVTN